MEQKNRHERLELDQDLSLTRKTWVFERIGWVGLGALLTAALLGLLGPGPLSSSVAGEPGASVRVEYQRFAHFESEADLRLELRPATADPFLELWVSSAYLRGIEVRGVTPAPAETRLEGDRLVYRYPRAGEGPMSVRFDILYRSLGRLEGQAGVVGGSSAAFSHWIYP